MRISYLILIAILVTSCNNQVQKQDLLYGTWRSSNDQYGLKLIISEDTLKEVYEDRALIWKYELRSDILIIINDKAERQKHLIRKLTNKELDLKPVESFQVNIAWIDMLVFFKE